VVGAAASDAGYRIGQRSIGPARLGLERRSYAQIFGRASSTTRFANRLTRLAFDNGNLVVYLSRAGRGVALLASGTEYRTAAGVTPCSRVRKLKRVYGRRLVVQRRHGHVVAYKLGRLTFVTASGKVGSIMLAKRRFPLAIAVNAAHCGDGEKG
jgi:hypothetical protein